MISATFQSKSEPFKVMLFLRKIRISRYYAFSKSVSVISAFITKKIRNNNNLSEGDIIEVNIVPNA